MGSLLSNISLSKGPVAIHSFESKVVIGSEGVKSTVVIRSVRNSISDAVVHVVLGVLALVAAEPPAGGLGLQRGLTVTVTAAVLSATGPAHGDQPAADPGLGEDQRLSVPPIRVGGGHRAVRL